MDLQASGMSERLGSLGKNDVTIPSSNKENIGCPQMPIPISENDDKSGDSLRQRCVIIQKDEKGYGLTVSGDNPVFVQSVKEDGAATRAGVQQGDRIIKVNGTLVTQSNHLEVVKLIKSGSYVALTLLGRPPGNQSRTSIPGGTVQFSTSPSGTINTNLPLNMSSLAPCNKPSSPSERVTAPQPVDAEKQQELTNRRIHTIRMMLEQELAYLDQQRSNFAKAASDKNRQELNRASKRVKTLQEQLYKLTGVQHEHGNVPQCPKSPSMNRSTAVDKDSHQSHPPLQHHHSENCNLGSNRSTLLTHQISAPTPLKGAENSAYDGSESINKKSGHSRNKSDMVSPLSQSPETKKWKHQSSNRHHRHISSPEGLSQFSEQLQAGNKDGISRTQSELVSRKDRVPELEFDQRKMLDKPMRLSSTVSNERITPPGTPPPPYVSSNCAHPVNIEVTDVGDSIDAARDELPPFQLQSCFIPEEPPPPPPRMSPCAIAANFEGRPLPPIPSQQNNSPQILSDGAPPALPPRPLPGQLCNIISMEEDDFPSDSEVSQLDDHGPFMSLWKLVRNPAHLAVFLYYLISSRSPSSLFFYLISESYKEGKLQEMKKWAYEIHSTFLVPEAPLRVNNVDETILHEVDDNLQNNLEKEEEIRNIFTKAKIKASEELNELLAEFRTKRTLGLGGFYGPPDHLLQEVYHDRSKEIRVIEQNLLPMLVELCEDFENADDKIQATASALATVMKQLGVKSQQAQQNIIDRIPTFVAKEKSRIRFLNRNKKVMSMKEHHFIPQHYCLVTYCNHCQLIIWGIGNQGYQCQNCEMNIHKNCVKVIEEVCLGPFRQKKDKKRDRMSGIMENIIGKNRKPSQNNLNDRSRKGAEDGETTSPLEGVNDCGDKSVGAPVPGSIAELQNNISRKGSGAIGRSESFRQRRENRPSFRKRSDPNIPRSKSDVDVDDKTIVLNSSQSSSNSSLSASLDSPSNSLETVSKNAVGLMTASKVDEIASSLPIGSGNQVQNLITSPHNIHVQHHVYDDSDLDAEVEAPNWQEGIEWEVVRTMTSEEKKRQDVLNELFHTEKTHVRNLKVLERVFYRPMLHEQVASNELIKLLFGNLEEMIEVHGSINSLMKEMKQSNTIIENVGDMMLNIFDGMAGENLKRAAATFCQNQSIALEMLKNKQRKDQKLSQFISEAEMNHLCRRLQLKDIIPTGMQRLTKYPLLLSSLAKYTTGAEEHQKILNAVECSKNILNFVNQSVKDAENRLRLLELMKKMDKSHFDKVDHPISHEFRNLDLAKYKLLHDGSLTWQLNKQKAIDVQLLILEQFLILLHKQDEKYALKFFTSNNLSGRDDQKLLLSPIVKLDNVLLRKSATNKKGFFIVTFSRAEHQQAMYELVAKSENARESWFKRIDEACDIFKKKSRNPIEPPSVLSERSESADDGAETERENKAKEPSEQLSPAAVDVSSASENGENTDSGETSDKDVTLKNIEENSPPTPPAEKLRRKDEQIVSALRDKQEIVAEILNVPPEEFENIADVVTEVQGQKEPRELILAAIVQVNNLASILNETLRVTEEDTVSATAVGLEDYDASYSESASSMPPRSPKSQVSSRKMSRMPAAPTHKLLSVSRILNQQLTEILHVIVERDEERQQFRKELRSSREQIHLLHEATRRRRENSSPATHSRPNSFTSIESSLSGDICVEANAPSENCNCDNPQSDEESGATISPLQGVMPETGIAETVHAHQNHQICEKTNCNQDKEPENEIFVDEPTDLPPVTIIPTTDLDCDHELVINVDDPNCDEEEMIVDSVEDSVIDAQNKQMSEEQSTDPDNNNTNDLQQSSIGAIFF